MAAAPARANGRPIPGDETILLVEDEDLVRALVQEILRRNGYRVLEALDVAHALRLSEQHAGGIDLLVTDVVMPGLGGGALAERLNAIRPGIKVLFTSGYTEDAMLPPAS